jgi:hypothetical protein
MARAPHPAQIERAMSEAQQLKQELIGQDGTIARDDRLLLDTLDGETDVMALIDRLVEYSMADQILAELAQARATRIKKRAEYFRGTVCRMLQALQLGRGGPIERAAFSLSLSDRDSVEITNEDAIPRIYIRHAPDKAALLIALREGPVKGAELVTNTSINVRTR